MKICYKCGENLNIEDFSKNKRYKDGLNDICKGCKKLNNTKVKDQIREYNSKYQVLNNESRKEYSRNYYINNQDYYLNYNLSRSKETIKQYNINSKEYKRKWNLNQYKTNPSYKLSQLLRIRFLSVLTGKTKKNESVLELLGCSLEECLSHIILQFKEGMSWDNHGEVWEIDHIKPCSKFDLTLLSERQKCFHYTNLQPLFKSDNRIKKDKYVPSCLL